MTDRNRKPIRLTVAPDVHAFLKSSDVNASQAVESYVRSVVPEYKIIDAALDADMTHDEIDEARQ